MKKASVWYVLASVSLLCFSTHIAPVKSFAQEIDDIRTAIKSKGAKWSAGETSISRLSQQERKQRVTEGKPVLASNSQVQSSAGVLTAPTGTFDWRNIGGNDYVTAIRDQGSCGGCWAFATAAALESYTLIHGGYTPGLDLAEQIVLSCSRAGSCGGGYIDLASTFIRDTGVSSETAYPYTATNGSCSDATSGWQDSAGKISMWKWIATTAPDVGTIKNALFTYGPLVTTMSVYGDFFSYQSGIYSYTTGGYAGGHGVLIVGYTDDSSVPGGGYFIVKNSWGAEWGEGGYFRIAYGELKSVVQFGYYTIGYDASAPPPCTYSISPKSKSFGSGGGTGGISVATGSGCKWSAQSNANWITIWQGASGSDPGQVLYAVAANTTNSSRTGVITITGNDSVLIFSVSQQRPRQK